MLSWLQVRNLAIVRKLELALGPGFTVLTGETGAGKSILIDALALLLGERAESSVIRHGCDQAEISAAFEVAPESDAGRWLAKQDLFGDRECILRRLIYRERATRGFINGRPVPMQAMRELGDLLVDIHGQHEHQSLLKREVQRRTLDDYAGHGDRVAELAATYRQWREARDRLDALRRQTADREARVELLRFQLQELEACAPEPGEAARLEAEHRRLAHAQELIQGLQATAARLYEADEGNVHQSLGQAVATLERLAEVDPGLAEVAGLLREAEIQVEEAATQLRRRLDRTELDPARLAEVEARLGTLHDLARKHRVSEDALPEVLQRLSQELSDLEDVEYNASHLEAEIAALAERYETLAAQIGAGRQRAAAELSEAVTARMQELGMPGGCFQVALTPLPADALTAYGREQVEFLVAANPGQPPRPLSKVASGGELSRISLALQVQTASIGRIPTLIFDEVDVGIGGRVAEIVGRELRTLGDRRQVLCITHLAQVAAQGRHHLRVEKQADPELDVGITVLDATQRVEEIARMIGGLTITDQTRAHAEDMLSRASA